ncbi:MAG: radical SAM protein, partial [Planctomycetota bacterium]
MPGSISAQLLPAHPTSGALALKHENSRLLREDIARQATVFRALPEIVTLNSTEICNLACVMCQRSVSQGKYRLEDRVVEFVAEQLFPTARKVVLTTAGGEPLGVGFDLILELARRHETRLDVTSNGQLLRAGVASRLLPVLDHLNVSVDSVDAETYERIRVGGSFERLEDNLAQFARLRAEGGHDVLLSLSAVVMASTLPHLDSLVRFAAGVGAQGVLFQRLQHTVKSTPDEDPTRHFTPEAIEGYLQAAEDAARECGINIFQGELGRPPVFVRPIRPKRPEPLDGAGVCSFLTQTFSVMYTGEVYPCCKPTDHLLGDVRFDDPVSIWNGPALQELRRAHYARTGTVFCRGCDLAPYLPKARSQAVGEAVKVGRRALAHVVNRRRRERREARELPLYDAPAPRFERGAPLVTKPRGAVRVQPVGRAFQALAIDPLTRGVVVVCEGQLLRWDTDADRALPWADLPGCRERFASLLHFTPTGDALLSFEDGGGLLRFERASGELSQVASLSDPRSFVRGG